VATIRDVARGAGVPPVIVSRVSNNSGPVSEETRQRVESAMEELHYVPNSLARSLRSRRTQTLALVITDVTNLFWTTVARGVEDKAVENGFSMILCNTDEDPEKEQTYLQVLIQKRVDGVIIAPTSRNGTSLSALSQQSIPFVVIDRRLSGLDADIVRGDSIGGAYQLTKYLIELGHRRIGIIAGPERISTAADRLAGYLKALGEFGIPVDDALIKRGGFDEEAGYELTKNPLRLEMPPTWSFYEEGADQKYIEYDVDKANALLDDMGLKWDADHEVRLRPDGKPLELYAEMAAGAFVEAFQLVVSYWKEIGVKVNIKPVDQALYKEHLLAGDLDIGTWGGGSPTEQGAHGSVPMRLVPPWHWASCCALAGLPWWEWYDSHGEEGEEPPPIIKELFAALDDWYAAPLGTDAYMKAGKKMVQINADNLWWFVVVGLTPSMVAPGNEVRNVREGPGVTFDVRVPPWVAEMLWIEE